MNVLAKVRELLATWRERGAEVSALPKLVQYVREIASECEPIELELIEKLAAGETGISRRALDLRPGKMKCPTCGSRVRV